MKRMLSLILVVCMVLAMVPAYASAQESNAKLETATDQVTVKGTNSLGNMMAEEIQEHQDQLEEESSGGYVVLGVTIEGKQATVSFDTLEDAQLMVGIYSEDGKQLVASGKTSVTQDLHEATVTITGTMPKYFLVRAFLLDTYDYSPLCQAYTTPMYTQEMQNLLNSTAEDYDQDRVLTLDEDTSTNFVVYRDDTVVVRAQSGTNTLRSADHDGLVYVFANADTAITDLQPGQVLAYENSASDVIVIKVKSISVSGATATVIGQNVELEEAFAYMKLEQVGDAGDMQADPSAQPEEGVTFEGVQQETEKPTRGAGADITLSHSLGFTLEKDIISAGAGKVSISGEFKLQKDIHLAFYVSTSQRFVEFTVSSRLEGTFSATAQLDLKLDLGVYVANLYGVTVGFAPELHLVFSAKISLSAAIVTTVGFAYEKGAGIQNLSSWPTLEAPSLSFEGSVYLGIDLCPVVKLLEGSIAKIDIHIPFGIELKGQMYTNPHYENIEDYEGTVHHCEQCIEMVMYFKFAPKVVLTFLNCDFFKVEWEIYNTRIKIMDLYYAVDTSTFGVGVCPNKSYRVTVAVEDAANAAVAGAPVVYDEEPFTYNNDLGTTNENGVVGTYLVPGRYTFRTQLDGQAYEYTHYIQQAGKVVLGPNVKKDRNFIAEKIDPAGLIDDGKVIQSGSCGDGVQYELYESGHLFIFGNGAMDNWSNDYNVPWHYKRSRITKVVVDDGVETVGKVAFCDCTNLTEVYLGDSVHTIGSYAFDNSQKLKSVHLPDSLVKVDNCAFMDCRALQELTIPEKVNYIGNSAFRFTYSLERVYYNAVNVTCPDAEGKTQMFDQRFDGTGRDSGGVEVVIGKNVQRLPEYLFGWGNYSTGSNYPKLKSVTFEEGSVCKEIGERAFYLVLGLTEIVLPEGLETIGAYAFSETDFSTIYIPSTVTSIGQYAFYWAQITELNLPASLTTLGKSAFSACVQLKKVTFNSGVETIPNYAFDRCSALEQVHLVDGTVTIGERAFGECTAMKTIQLPNTVTSIGVRAFYKSGIEQIQIPDSVITLNNYAFAESSLRQVTLGQSLTTIGRYAFQKCAALEYVVIPNSVTTIDYYAFQNCTGMTELVIGSGVTKINMDAFSGNTSLATITFYGNAPTISFSAFSKVKATVYYPSGNSSWSSYKRTNYGGTLTWKSYQPGERTVRNIIFDTPVEWETSIPTETQPTEKPQTRAVYPGSQQVEAVGNLVGCNAAFTNLVPGQEYVVLVLASMEVEDLLAPSNLVYIYQSAADENGALAVEYVRPVMEGATYLMACGASYDDITKATVEFPLMGTDGQLQAVDPVVTYEGQVLTEGQDYVIVGTADFATPGTYNCYIRGIYDYTGMLACSYSVRGDVVTTHTDQWDKVVLQCDTSLALNLTQDMYLDLNGYDLTGTVDTGAYSLYLMDSSTNGYSAANAGSFACVTEDGAAYVPQTNYQIPDQVMGEPMQYLTLSTDHGFSFHRYSLEVTHMTIDPSKTAVGYKAVFYGDEAVIAALDTRNALGFAMQLEGFDTHSYYLPMGQVTNGRVVSMRLSNYMVEDHGQTKLQVTMRLKLKNGTVIDSAPCAYSLREMVELVNEDHTNYSAAQLEALADMIRQHPVMQSWNVSNIPV